MRALQALIFDIDGILLDTEAFQYIGWAGTAEQLAGYQLSEEEYAQDYCGNSSTWIAQQVKDRFALPQTTEAILAYRETLVQEAVRTLPVQQMPYAREILENHAKKTRIALATGAGNSESDLKLSRSGLDTIIKTYAIPVITRTMVPHGKPAPDSYLLAAQTLGADPEGCVAVEDTVAGVQAAELAGMVCLPVPNRWTRKQLAHLHTYETLHQVEEHLRTHYSFQPRR